MMKKIIALLLTLLLLFTLGACKKSEDGHSTTEPQSAESISRENFSEIETSDIQTVTTMPSAIETTVKAEVTTKKISSEITTIKTTAASDEKINSVSFTIQCRSILSNMDDLKVGKSSFVPSDGVIFASDKVNIQNGDTVFDVFKRVCSENNILFEAVYTAAFDSYYIKGINQIYEKDCGKYSGWLYKVNGESPMVSCSAYTLKNGDQVEIFFSCDMNEEF